MIYSEKEGEEMEMNVECKESTIRKGYTKKEVTSIKERKKRETREHRDK